MVAKCIAIIPARGGSKRIHHKNIIDFCGKSMIAWSIEAALRSNCFSKVLVSTDCEQIAEIAKRYGAEVPFLRCDYSDDYSPVSLATISSLKQAEDYWEEKFSTVVQLMPNCPLRNELNIKEALFYFNKNNFNYQISCFKFGWMNPWWAYKLMEDNKPLPLFPNKGKKRSQDLEDLYCPTGAIWIAKSEMLKKSKTFYGNDYYLKPMHWKNAIDIDDMDDMLMAKALWLMEHGYLASKKEYENP